MERPGREEEILMVEKQCFGDFLPRGKRSSILSTIGEIRARPFFHLYKTEGQMFESQCSPSCDTNSGKMMW